MPSFLRVLFFTCQHFYVVHAELPEYASNIAEIVLNLNVDQVIAT